MVFNKGDGVIVNHNGGGQFFLKLTEDLDTQRDETLSGKNAANEIITLPVSVCKIKFATKEQKPDGV